MPVRLQVLGELPAVEGGVLTQAQADSPVGCLSLWGRPCTLQDVHDVLIEPSKRLTAPNMAAKQLLNRSAETSELLQSVLPIYLVDGQQPVLCADTWAILAHSPSMSRYKEFRKGTAVAPLQFMPPFELEELRHLRPWVLPGQEALTQDMVRDCTRIRTKSGLHECLQHCHSGFNMCPS